ncbi:MAG: helix-turn-helix transcriptional regulator [Lachnospiraceae bacterium]
MERSTIIRKLMEDKGMKVSDISRDSGIAYSTVKSILENGTEKASYVNICKICESVGITADKLESMVKNNKFAEQELSKEDYERIRKYKFISTNSPDGANVIDMVLDREYAIAAQLKKQTKYIEKLELLNSNNDFIDPYADIPDTLEELEEQQSESSLPDIEHHAG